LVRGSTIRWEVFGTFGFLRRWSSENSDRASQAKKARIALTLLETVWDKVLPLTPGRFCRCRMYSLTSISEISLVPLSALPLRTADEDSEDVVVPLDRRGCLTFAQVCERVGGAVSLVLPQCLRM
jgi:hypothetical protein